MRTHSWLLAFAWFLMPVGTEGNSEQRHPVPPEPAAVPFEAGTGMIREDAIADRITHHGSSSGWFTVIPWALMNAIASAAP
jgi:hypothetical protein